MLALLGASILLVGFLAILRWGRIVERTNRVLAIARSVSTDIRNPHMDDREKEAALKGYAGRLFGLSIALFIVGAAAVLLPIALVWGLDRAGALSFRDTIEVASSLEFILASMVFGTGCLLIRRK